MGWFEIKPTDSKRLTGWPLTRTHPRTIPEPQAPAKPVKCGNPTQLGRRDVAATQGELCFASMFNSGCFTNRDFHVLNFRSVVQDRTIWYSWAPLELKTPITWYYVWGSFFDRKLNLNKCLGRAERMLDFSKAWLTSQFLENPENWDVFKTWYYNVIDYTNKYQLVGQLVIAGFLNHRNFCRSLKTTRGWPGFTWFTTFRNGDGVILRQCRFNKQHPCWDPSTLKKVKPSPRTLHAWI